MLRGYRLSGPRGDESKALAERIVDLLLAEGKTFDISIVALEEAQDLLFEIARPVRVDTPDSAGQ